jgi:SAM-dependent methyltransferase
VVNVGAGAGSYEPSDRSVMAVEPSATMLAQRAPHAAPAIRARAEALPFAAESFDAALAVLTIHHWADQHRGLAECVRVARQRVVLLTWDPASDGFWLVQEYFPDLLAHDRQIFPRLDTLALILGEIDVRPVPIPGDCIDGFLGAFWRRPAAYLDPAVRSGMSSFARLRDPAESIERLRADLASGDWARRHAALSGRSELDVGYRLVIAEQR